jgi:hypothetical protein
MWRSSQLSAESVLDADQTAPQIASLRTANRMPDMKNLLAILMLLTVSMPSIAQPTHPLPTVDGKITFSEVVHVEGTSKDELYARARLWFAEAFRSANDVLQLDDKNGGVLLGKGVIKQETGGNNAFSSGPSVVKTWRFTIKIQLRDGRYKVDVYDIDYSFEQPEYNHMPGFRPSNHNLDTLFSDKKMYDRDGNLKEGAPLNIANWTNETFSALLESIRKTLSQKVTVDDF